MNQSKLLIGVGVGAAIAYMLDPNRGRRRRALVADQVRRASGKTRDAIDATMRDMTNRAVGIAAATRARLAHDDVDDATLIERVRATLGRVCSHSRAIDVEVDDGNVTLRGPRLRSELDTVLGGVAAVRGVRSVNNELEQHVSAEGVPSLQGSSNVAGPTLDFCSGTGHPARRRWLQRQDLPRPASVSPHMLDDSAIWRIFSPRGARRRAAECQSIDS
jgi:gas vesicle protein